MKKKTLVNKPVKKNAGRKKVVAKKKKVVKKKANKPVVKKKLSKKKVSEKDFFNKKKVVKKITKKKIKKEFVHPSQRIPPEMETIVKIDTETPFPEVVKQPVSGYSYETSLPAYKAEKGAKLMQMKLVQSMMESHGGSRTLKQLQEDFRKMKIYLPQSTISGRMSDLRDLGIVEFNGVTLDYKDYKRKVFEIIPVERRKQVTKTVSAIARERKNKYAAQPYIVAEGTSIDPARPVTPEVPIQAEDVKPEKVKKEKVVKEKVVKEKVVKEKKSQLPDGAIVSNFFD